MKALFLNAKEIRALKEYLAQSDEDCCHAILQKVEKAESRETKYGDVIFHIYKEAHQEIVSFFRQNKIEHLDFPKCLYITKESRLDSLHIENYSIYAKCMDGESYDISYSDSLPFITEYLRTLKK